MKRKFVYSFIIILSIFIVIIGFISLQNSGEIKSGVKIGGEDFSGISRVKAEQTLDKSYFVKNKNTKLIFEYNRREWSIPFHELKVKYDTKKSVQEAYNIGRTKGFMNNTFESLVTLISGKDIQVPISFDKKILNKKLIYISKEINKPGKSALIIINKNVLQKIPEENGLRLDIEKAERSAEESISGMRDDRIALTVVPEYPKYSLNDINDIDGEIGKAETVFSLEQKNRVSNIKKALVKINGTILLPGETLSLNKILGARSAPNGYKDAPVIVNDKLVPGLGGGVCQVATTLYKSSLQACLQVVERRHHTFPPAYVPVGQDATIAGESIDLKIKNNHANAVFIAAEKVNRKMVIRIFSKKDSANRRVQIESQVFDVLEPGPQQIIRDNSIQTGESRIEKEEKKGYKVAVFRNIYNGSVLVSREQLSYDFYRPIRGVIRIGTGVFAGKEKEVMKSILPEDGSYYNERENIEEPDNPPDI